MTFPRSLSRHAAAALLILCAGCAHHAQNASSAFRLEPGDLLFQDLDGSPLCDAIEKVTQGTHGAKFSHVGMVSRVEGDSATLIEAVSAGVKETPLNEFLGRSADAQGHPKVLVGRLKAEYRRLIPEAIRVAEGFRGRPYDSVFAMGNDSFYCSELIYEAFREANGGTSVFPLAPMTFKDPDTHTTFPAWTDYYAKLGKPIPEGEPGLNPGGISRSSVLTIVHAYGSPAGWRH
jgi:hypothetical protein